MMHRYLLAFLLLLASPLARAQASPAPARPAVADSARLQPEAASLSDTATALHRLFARRQRNGHTSLAVGASLLAAGGVAVAIGLSSSGEGGLAPLAGGVLSGLFGLPIAVRGAVVSGSYAKGREQRMVRAWRAHHLPRRVRRQLQPQDFEAGSPALPTAPRP